MIEGGEGAGHHGDVHDVPEISHISSWVQYEALIENLQNDGNNWLTRPQLNHTSILLEVREDTKVNMQ